MSQLMDFLLENDISALTEDVTISNRIPFKFKIKPMTKTQHAEFMRRCQSPIKKGGMDFDSSKFQVLVCTECTIEPSFSDAEAIGKAKANTAAELLGKTLLPGEIAELHARICTLSGFDSNIKEDIDEAKN